MATTSKKTTRTSHARKPRTSKTVRNNVAPVPPFESKTTHVIQMLRRKDGATLENIMKTTGWQKHSVRGFISIVTKKMDLPIASLKNDKGDRCYRIEK